VPSSADRMVECGTSTLLPFFVIFSVENHLNCVECNTSYLRFNETLLRILIKQCTTLWCSLICKRFYSTKSTAVKFFKYALNATECFKLFYIFDEKCSYQMMAFSLKSYW